MAQELISEIDYILISTRWRILQNSRVYWCAEFCGTDHRLDVATLRVHFKTPRHSMVFHLDRLKKEECARRSPQFTALENPGRLGIDSHNPLSRGEWQVKSISEQKLLFVSATATYSLRSMPLSSSLQKGKEPEVEIRLSSEGIHPRNEVCFLFREGRYVRVTRQTLAIDLLTLPTRVVHKETAQFQEHDIVRKETNAEKDPEGMERVDIEWDISEDMKEVYGNVMSTEQLAKLDSQPNPFNFSERVSQTAWTPCKTDPPPGNTYSDTASFRKIYDAYEKDHTLVLAKQREVEREEREEEKQKEISRKSINPKVMSRLTNPITIPLPPAPSKCTLGGVELDFDPNTVKMVERILNQNTHDEINQDFRYWEDASDEYRQLEGSLLPLWKFHCNKSRSQVVSSLSWSPAHHDLFVASYTPDKLCALENEGRICLFTLKNPGIPERMLVTPQGVTSVQFHPSRESVVVAGHCDGTVTVYDAAASPGRLSSSTTSDTGNYSWLYQLMLRTDDGLVADPYFSPETVGLMYLAMVARMKMTYLYVPMKKQVLLLSSHINHVCCLDTEPGQNPSFYSVSQDGRVSQWFVHSPWLKCTDILDFHTTKRPTRKASSSKVSLEDTGALFQVCTSKTKHSVIRYPAHLGPVTAVTWNNIHKKVFASCSLDWNVKMWLQYHLSPIVTLDLGGPVVGLAWSPSSSTVIVAVTEEGRVYVYDLFLRKCHPLCVQNLVQRRRFSLASVAFSPYQPVILVGGEKGYLVAFKLSPNLRKLHKDAKDPPLPNIPPDAATPPPLIPYPTL
ncbi:dynein intermediate chain 2, ciliary-like [Penaeus indicus]|uniref:dynein intermediate chain 2, ciliary-like n=1 Tax=Penaeus indicus TaxID=29960 RepID=UPI00300CC77C